MKKSVGLYICYSSMSYFQLLPPTSMIFKLFRKQGKGWGVGCKGHAELYQIRQFDRIQYQEVCSAPPPLCLIIYRVVIICDSGMVNIQSLHKTTHFMSGSHIYKAIIHRSTMIVTLQIRHQHKDALKDGNDENISIERFQSFEADTSHSKRLKSQNHHQILQ